MKKPRPQFFALHKDFNGGKVKPYDVLKIIFDQILTEKGSIDKKKFVIWDSDWNKIPVRTKEQLESFIDRQCHYYFWARAEWEFVIIDWPYSESIDRSRPVKIDVYEQLKPNIPVITDLVWDYIEPKVRKLVEKEKNK